MFKQLSLLTVVCLTSFCLASATDVSVKAYVSGLKDHEFTLRANLELFGAPGRGIDGREIRENTVALNGEDVIIGQSTG